MSYIDEYFWEDDDEETSLPEKLEVFMVYSGINSLWAAFLIVDLMCLFTTSAFAYWYAAYKQDVSLTKSEFKSNAKTIFK